MGVKITTNYNQIYIGIIYVWQSPFRTQTYQHAVVQNSVFLMIPSAVNMRNRGFPWRLIRSSFKQMGVVLGNYSIYMNV